MEARHIDARTLYFLNKSGLGEPQPAPVIAKQNPKGGHAKKNRGQRAQAVREVQEITDSNAQFGDMKMIQSSFKTDRIWTPVQELNSGLNSQSVWIRGRVHAVRKAGNKMCFMLVRQEVSSVQALIVANEAEDSAAVKITREMVKYCAKIPPESIVDLYGKVKKVEKPVSSATQSDVEVSVERCHVISASLPELPFQITDAGMRGSDEAPTGHSSHSTPIKEGEEKKDHVTVGRALRLDHRWIDARTQSKHAIFRIQSAVGQYFREYFIKKNFMEIHTPKIVPGVSEGGANVFRFDYFGKPACLAQSPQLYKQMAVQSGLGGVFEIAPVFRAENANTHRHLTEFVGLDFEMPIYEHYSEVLEVLGSLFVYIFDQINEHHKDSLKAINEQYPFSPLKYRKNTLILKFNECIEMLQEVNKKLTAEGLSKQEIFDAGAECKPLKDFSTPNEKLLGRLIKEKYDVDFYIIDRYPLAARPFYTMPAPDDSNYTNSYDVFLRGEEITSGAQRIHEPTLLEKRARECEIPVPSIQSYIDCFKHGGVPHGGAGIGLERVVMLFLGLNDVRNVSLFPRDPRRHTP